MIFTLLIISNFCWSSTSADTCTNYGGTCQDSSKLDCEIGQYETGMCNGASNIQCCLQKDYKCYNNNGTCFDTSKLENTEVCIDGYFVTGYCSDSEDVKCCIPGEPKVCDLQRVIDSKYIYGYYHEIWVEKSFLPCTNAIENVAKNISDSYDQAIFQVMVTQAFRIDGVPVNDPVVPPATHSNHLVGHAIDFNLQTELGWCNSKCLLATYNDQGKTNFYAYEFIKQIQTTGYTWGGIWQEPDSVHIDDRLNEKDVGKWEELYAELQPNCQLIFEDEEPRTVSPDDPDENPTTADPGVSTPNNSSSNMLKFFELSTIIMLFLIQNEA